MDPQRFSLKDFRLYLAVSGVTAVALFTYNRILGTVALILTAICAYYAYNSAKRYNQELDDRIKYLHKDFEKVTEQTVFAMPFPMAVTDEAGKILWHNSRFSKLWDTSSLQGEFLPKLVDDLATEEKGLKAIESGEEITVAENPYAAYSNLVALSRNGKEDNLCLFYFVDRKEYKDLELLYTDTRGVVLVVEVDNFDEVVDGAPTSKRPLLIAEIDHSINEYFRSRNALVRKFQEDMYLIVMREMDLESVYAQKFDILDTMREIDAGNTISVTISAGVSRPGLAFIDAYREADTCLDVALGRGGDQVVVQTEDNYAYFGGKSKAVEKRNKVKARVLGIALRQLIEKAPRVFVMGHTNPDMDSIGAAVGVMRAVANQKKEGYIVLKESNPSIDVLMKRMQAEAPELYARIIPGTRAEELIRQGDLLILVDNHKPSFTEYPPILEKTVNVVVVDHHRRGKEFVTDPVLSYVEPYASSTCELITEMLTYMYKDVELTDFEADALMSGIVVDTKNFTFRTGVRTFEAASALKRSGADMSKVRFLFEDDYDTIVSRAEVVHNARIVFDNIAISRLVDDMPNSVLVSAQAADELLGIHGVKASFVLNQKKGVVHISGRSFGEISVQLILERLGGGGHLNMAGAQIEGEDIDEVEHRLVESIQWYLDKGEKES
ncbi:c-di-AMP phosphodiesterase-like protein [Peptoniphilus ivorii]|uniref:DHH family phosphoesterase n=1 Tax=Aedoeadaptatus ivorii TaxID=54006 RepID=UPI00277FD42B|nr:DHH family phosphoesterase [Peptoniphilus ivorii]MDQ0508857.1 c-di-AMP phosphodiesterase-like protein [Peptoniphilus ivorii]